MKWLALDIGGANIKAADGERFAAAHHFAMWETPQQLADVLRAMIAQVPKVDHLAATMTGELADCFTTKAEGVQFILQALNVAADGRHTRIYLTSGFLVTPQIALRQPLLAAASNWHALASFAGRYAKRGAALLIDVGSTTCDVIPLMDGVPIATGKTDPERLISGELVYTGAERSPICALLRDVVWRGQQCNLAQEVFATTWDAYLMLGEMPDEPQQTHTADGKPATRAAARDRLARMICCDRTMFDEDDARAMSASVAVAQLQMITEALGKVIFRLPAAPNTVVISGRGEFIARRAVQNMQLPAAVVSLTSQLGPDISKCATAHALAVLAKEGTR
jgi:probable H4MPT-linked C1 transfer pathway protein